MYELGLGGLSPLLRPKGETSIKDVGDVLNNVKLDGNVLKHGELHGEIEGDIAAIEGNIAKDATPLGLRLYQLKDGTYIKFYESTLDNGTTMQINTGEIIYKIRIK